MLDISKITNNNIAPWVFFGILCLSVLITIIVWTKRGIVKDIFVLGYLVGLYFMFVYLYPIVNDLLEKVPFLAGKTTQKMIISIVAILIVWIIVKAIINKIFKKIFKKAKKATKAFGFIASLPTALVISILVIDLASPLVLNGGEKLTNNQLTDYYISYVVDPVKEGLYNSLGIPVDFESYMSSKASTEKETQQKYYQSFKNVNEFRVDPTTYIANLATSEDVVSFNSDISYVTIIVNNANIGKMSANQADLLTTYISCYEGQVVHLGDQYDTFVYAINNAGLDESVVTKATTIFKN